jgi:uncharacterized membrane protein
MPKQKLPAKLKKLSLERVLPYILIVGGAIGSISSLIITNDKFTLLQHPGTKFACDLNPVISCGSVMQSTQAHVFGFMNPYIGLLGFPMLLSVGVAMLAGARFRRWFWVAMLAGVSLGIIFAYWLLFESIYRIKALCPYCLAVDVTLTTIFWYLLLYVGGKAYGNLSQQARRALHFGRKHHLDILLLWFIVVIAIILNHFWYYYGQHLHL